MARHLLGGCQANIIITGGTNLITTMRLRQILCVNPQEVLLYGYTFDRRTLILFIDSDDYLVRVTEGRDGRPDLIEKGRLVHPEMWNQNVKRWYRDATNDALRELCNSFLEYGLTETPGGDRMKHEEYYTNEDDAEVVILDTEDQLREFGGMPDED